MTRTLTVVMLLFGASLFASQPITKETITSGNNQRTYYLFLPERPPGAPSSPLIVTLHAAKEGIVLAGPDATNPEMWQYPLDGPAFLRDVIDDVKKKTAIDPRRIYLFGHSAGAIMGLYSIK